MPRIPTFQPSNLDWSRLTPNLARPTGWQYLGKGLQNLGESLKKREQKRQDKIDNIFLLDFSNKLKNTRRQEFIDIKDQVRLADTQELTFEEQGRMADTKDKTMQDVPNHLLDRATSIYNTVNSSYLDRVASHEVSETFKWGALAEKEAIIAAQQEATSRPIGDFQGVFNIIGDLGGKFIDTPERAAEAGKDMIVQVVSGWARLDPVKTEQAVVKHNATLLKVMGAQYNDMLKGLRTGTQLAKADSEYKYRLAKRKRTELEDQTMSTGVELFLNPKKQLTIDWIVANEKKMRDPQPRILYTLLESANNAKPLTESQADPMQLYRLTKMVNRWQAEGLNPDSIAMSVAGSIEKSITTNQGNKLLKELATPTSLTSVQQSYINKIDKLEFSGDANEVIMKKLKVEEGLRQFYKENPDKDPDIFFKQTWFKDEMEEAIIEQTEALVGSDILQTQLEAFQPLPEMSKREAQAFKQVIMQLQNLKATGVKLPIFDYLDKNNIEIGENAFLYYMLRSSQ